jgi:hypothetical protein
MSTLQSTATRHRTQSLVRAAWFALGILIAFGVAFVILAAGRTSRHAVTYRFQPVIAPAHDASRATDTAGRRLVVDPGSGFAVPVH